MWQRTGNLNTARKRHTATQLADGRILTVAGQDADNFWLASAEIYDPATGNWSLTSSLNNARVGHTGNWSGGISGDAACSTDSSGTCTVTSSNVRKKRDSLVFTVSNVSHAALAYDPGANRDPDGDSDGTTITVSTP